MAARGLSDSTVHTVRTVRTASLATKSAPGGPESKPPDGFENDIVLRITLPLLFLYSLVKLVAGILGFPITKWHTDFVQECTINVTAVFSRANVLVFSNEDEILLPSPLLQ
ncbi:hypothetical protein ACVWZ6_009165 [Bradyrhizobium sp. GM6.1]